MSDPILAQFSPAEQQGIYTIMGMIQESNRQRDKRKRDIAEDAFHPPEGSPAKKRGKHERVSDLGQAVLQNVVYMRYPLDAAAWSSALLQEREKVLYDGEIETEPPSSKLPHRFGIGDPEDIGNFADYAFTKWLAKGKALKKKGCAEIGGFIVTAVKNLRKEIDRCDEEYGERYDLLKESWEEVEFANEGTALNVSMASGKSLSEKEREQIQSLQQHLKHGKRAVKEILKEKENGLEAQYDKLIQVTKKWGEAVKSHLHQIKVIELPGNAKQLQFYDFFKNRCFLAPKRDEETDLECRQVVVGFYNDYSKMLDHYQVYLRRFIACASYAQDIYGKGLKAFELLPPR